MRETLMEALANLPDDASVTLTGKVGELREALNKTLKQLAPN